MTARLLRDRAKRAWVGISVASATTIAVTAASPARAAPTPHECATASEDAATLEKQDKLLASKERYLVCADAACPAEIREECGHRLTEIGDALPSVVFDVKDAAGSDVSAVRVTMDGALLTDHLGAAAVTIDPGDHLFRFETADPSQTVEKRFVVRDAEKNRHLAVALGGAVAPGATGAGGTAHVEKGSKHPLGTQKLIAIIAGGAGAVGLVVGAAFGAKTFSEWSTAKNECTVASCGPGSAAQNDKNTASSWATISDVGFIAGGVLLAGAAVVWFTAPSGAAVQVTPTAGPQGGGLMLRGTF